MEATVYYIDLSNSAIWGKGGVKRHAFGLGTNMVVLTTSPLFVDINRLK